MKERAMTTRDGIPAKVAKTATNHGIHTLVRTAKPQSK